MRSVSETIAAVAPSATMAMSNRSKEMIASGIDVISLAVGEPDFATPAHITQAAIDALNRGETHYAPSRGLPELTQAVAEKLNRDNHIAATQKQIMVTAGAKDAIRITMMATLNKGDEVVVIDPSWVSYEPCVQIAGGKAVHYSLNADFQVDESIYDVITDKTKMIIVNTPSNPTGSVLGRSSLRLIADVCTDHDLFCLSDEIYEKLVYGKEHVSIATIGDMLDRTITINGFSKAYAMTGWRLGYLAAPLDVIPAMDKVMQHSVGCVNTFAMWGGVAALTGDQTCVEEMRKQFEQRRSFVIGRLAGMGLSTAPAEGAFYAFINVGGDDVATANKWLDKAHVAATPGTAFGAPGWIRISYAASMERLAEALDRIEAVQ
ncbi:MAG TPA: pyridoxal phosphate-dependent aminotransferase [Methanocorpusculum sp.]|nr:pyridoxal phosphate-dependent aminotransferase [Methanocorpusculum sp.]HJK10949.1 pyridoxal phosphate-dependent aminotransferase [Methanocorpusculum sp.]HJK22245.1 pyridoxal phosphate-dependent aminotransferase [Methanocorpusculum sp.]HJK23308.1 pyridoxal phosphate-dependent aminotransferase [Methanocorpusculum sp.]HJK30412.1 pyridoxal phosphate-dependent aminotransferase [Methanocorpusculum sp.]